MPLLTKYGKKRLMETFENRAPGSRLLPDELDARSRSGRSSELRGRADGRFAPSPTGPLHLGNLRTALLAWLFARSVGARFLVRVEDLDRSRVRPGVEEAQLADLQAIGLDWDGPAVRQSERIPLYEEAVARLDFDGHLYPATARGPRFGPRPPRLTVSPPPISYPGNCRELTAIERAEREAAGRPPALRVRAECARVAFEDRLSGRCEEEVDDFVVRRNAGAPAYQLAVTVDDAAQEIGEVVRGADLVDSTPRQLLLAHLLGLPAVPRYAHVPLVLGSDGRRLAKRHGAVTLAERSILGEGPGGILDWMARSLGLGEIGETPTPADLLVRFAPDRLPLEPTVWPPEERRTTHPKIGDRVHNRASIDGQRGAGVTRCGGSVYQQDHQP
jgi:glutamyl-tRNA synthetase